LTGGEGFGWRCHGQPGEEEEDWAWEGRGWSGEGAKSPSRGGMRGDGATQGEAVMRPGQGARSERVGAGARTDRSHPDQLDFDLTSDLCANV
jgi:hypothetical protein